MTLIVETGAGLSNAESFASVADADAYHAARGAAAWAALSTGDKEVNLRKATDYMEQQYLSRWSGCRVYQAQALAWPRADVYRDRFLLPSNAVPAEVVKACCELALKASTGELSTDAGAQVKSEQVGPIAVVYADGARQGTKYTAVEGMLSALFGAGGAGSIRLVRA